MKVAKILLVLIITAMFAACGDNGNTDPSELKTLKKVTWQSAFAFCINVQHEKDLRTGVTNNKMKGCSSPEAGLHRVSFENVLEGSWKGGAERTSDGRMKPINVIISESDNVQTIYFDGSAPPQDGGVQDSAEPDTAQPDAGVPDSAQPDTTQPDAAPGTVQLVPVATMYMNAGDTYDLDCDLKYKDANGQEHCVPGDEAHLNVISGNTVTIGANSNGDMLLLQASQTLNGLTKISWVWDQGTLNPDDDLSSMINVHVLNAQPPDAGVADSATPVDGSNADAGQSGAVFAICKDASTGSRLNGCQMSVGGANTCTTNGTGLDAGSCYITGLAPGVYSLVASKTDYVTSQPKSVTVVSGQDSAAEISINPVSTSGDGGVLPPDSGPPDSGQADAGPPVPKLVKFADQYLNAGDTLDLEGKLKYDDGTVKPVPADELYVQVITGDSLTVVKNPNNYMVMLKASLYVGGVNKIIWWWNKGTLDPTDDEPSQFVVWVMNPQDPPDGGVPDSTSPDAGVDGSVPVSDGSVPDSASPDAGVEDSGVEDSALPDSSQLDSALPDASSEDSALDSGVEDSALPDSSQPDSALPDSGSEDSASPDASTAMAEVKFKCYEFGTNPAVPLQGCVVKEINFTAPSKTCTTTAYGACPISGLPMGENLRFEVKLMGYNTYNWPSAPGTYVVLDKLITNKTVYLLKQ